MNHLTIGIDPGFTGGLAYVSHDLSLAWSTPMPVKKNKINGRTEIDVKEFAEHIKRIKCDDLCVGAIEDVAAMPKQGVTGVFRFGYGAGLVTGVLTAYDIPILKLKPASWKSAMGLDRDKAKSIVLAQTIAKRHGHLILASQLKKDGPAEAFLIAYYAATTFKGVSFK